MLLPALLPLLPFSHQLEISETKHGVKDMAIPAVSSSFSLLLVELEMIDLPLPLPLYFSHTHGRKTKER